jgi:quercetin dioxygenase-like cupin family protein
MEKLIKNLEHAKPLPLKEQVAYEPGRVVSLTLAQQPGVGMTLFAFDAGEGVSTHAAPGDAMVYVLEGEAQITIDGAPHSVTGGSAIILPAASPRGGGRHPLQNAPYGSQRELNSAPAGIPTRWRPSPPSKCSLR